MRNFIEMLYNTVFILAAVVVFMLVALGIALKSFGDSVDASRPAIYYPNAPEITVMQIDSGVDFNIEDLGVHIPQEYHSVEYMDNNGHGTHTAGIILKDTCLNVKLIPCKFWDNYGDKSDTLKREVSCLKTAYDDNVDLVNFSGGGQFPNKEELEILKKLGKKNVVVVVSAGNDNHEITLSNKVDEVNKYLDKCNDIKPCDGQKFYYYPASYKLKNLLKVANYHNNSKAETSNYADTFLKEDGEGIESYAPGGTVRKMTGTSQAAAGVSNKILIEMCNLNK